MYKLFWLPRILAFLYIGFLSLFALDVFEPGKDLIYYAIALFMHLIPSFILAVILLVAWKREKMGGLLFILAFIALFSMFWDRSFVWLQFLFFSPLLIIGILFLLYKKKVSKE